MNLKPIGQLSEKERAEAEAEIRNAGYLPSMYDPVKLLWHYWIKLKVAQAAAAPAPAAAGPQDVDQAIAELERLIEQKERELAELRAKLEELKRLKSVSGRVASLEPAAPVEVGVWSVAELCENKCVYATAVPCPYDEPRCRTYENWRNPRCLMLMGKVKP
jgi:vacuolar-type H+-ATPase subunit I/STV1